MTPHGAGHDEETHRGDGLGAVEADALAVLDGGHDGRWCSEAPAERSLAVGLLELPGVVRVIHRSELPPHAANGAPVAAPPGPPWLSSTPGPPEE